MCIRDWSSVVCSSDLAPAANHVPAASDFTVSLTRDGSKNTPSISASPRLCAKQFLYAPSRYSLFVLFAVLQPRHHAMIQIGIASFSERVWHFVSFAVVALQFKTKYTNLKIKLT